MEEKSVFFLGGWGGHEACLLYLDGKSNSSQDMVLFSLLVFDDDKADIHVHVNMYRRWKTLTIMLVNLLICRYPPIDAPCSHSLVVYDSAL